MPEADNSNKFELWLLENGQVYEAKMMSSAKSPALLKLKLSASSVPWKSKFMLGNKLAVEDADLVSLYAFNMDTAFMVSH